MNKDYAYCENENTCIHRRGCKRWKGNYSKTKWLELNSKANGVSYVDETKCIPNYRDEDCKNMFDFLDRFRLSNGEDFK